MKKHVNQLRFFENKQEDSLDYRPNSRKKLLLSMISEHKFDLFFLSLIYTVVYFPAELWTFFSILILQQGVADMGLQQWLFQYLLLFLPLFTISGPFSAGLYRVFRNWARDEPLKPADVFRSAVKDSWKTTTGIATVSALIPMLTLFAFQFAASYLSHMVGIVIFLGFVFVDLLWILLLPTLQIMAVTYNLTLPQMLWNSLYMTLRHPLKSVKTRILADLPLLITAAFCVSYPNAVFFLLSILAAYHIFYGFGLRQMLFAAHGNTLCEQHLNGLIPGAKVDIGLSTERIVEKS